MAPPAKPFSEVVKTVPPSGIRKFFDLAQSMQGVISLGVGEPDFPTPWSAREAAIHALEHGATTYTSNSGLLELREEVCSDLADRYRVRYRPEDECLITSGVSEGLDLTLRALLNPGDEVIVPEPCYVAYAPCVAFAGGTPVPVALDPADAYRLDPALIGAAVTGRTKAILFGSPSNPTGSAQSADDLRALAALAVEHDLWLLSDEIYDRLTYQGTHTPASAADGAWERTVLLGGFSKSYAMTGWRVGYVCAPEPLAALMHRIHQYTMLCAPHMSQIAALEAMRTAQDEVEDMVADYDRRRRLFAKGLDELGLTCPEPGGAFYVFPSIRTTGMSSEEFAEGLLTQEKVAVVPGGVFGPSGEGHVRCSYATALPQLEQALERIARFIS
ncbi:aminotransferase class I/II-fold pyridoxal phosphate-dependent enzyme [Actinomycetospora endophytica]|uniref:Aminotransferase n=1 Tax=Actinomycetospora endophytica TaxID=2291215 RepID=A0ABS8PHR3_9PSEU|nr:aminotransferase class I/II-fold pyridoxal phosphate-dependent enzyme [Actinomycetospora endophytica]MCD2197798.1 aminotransferase class I/II-fold pyridoxal phosphate-dependent enzyme [Actinomycetospora endophytica]